MLQKQTPWIYNKLANTWLNSKISLNTYNLYDTSQSQHWQHATRLQIRVPLLNPLCVCVCVCVSANWIYLILSYKTTGQSCDINHAHTCVTEFSHGKCQCQSLINLSLVHRCCLSFGFPLPWNAHHFAYYNDSTLTCAVSLWFDFQIFKLMQFIWTFHFFVRSLAMKSVVSVRGVCDFIFSFRFFVVQ